MCKSGIGDTKRTAISETKQSKLLQSVYRNSCRPTAYRLVTNLVT